MPLTLVKGVNSPLHRAAPVSIDEQVRYLSRRRRQTNDAMMTFDQNTIDSAGVFLVGELERLDQKLHMPLASVTWGRDIDVRTDVSIGDERSSFTNSTFASPQGIAGSNKAWAGKDSTAIAGVGLDIGKTVQPLELWAVQLSWTIPELASSQALGRPVDDQKFQAMQLKYQMDCDEQVYIGDTVLGMNGMLNHSQLTNTGNAVNGNWATATPAQILADINSLLNSVWAATGWAIIPNRLLLSPTQYGILVSTLISSAGNISVLSFILANNLAKANGQELIIAPCKWLIGTNNAGQGPTATDSMFAYVKDPIRVRFPLVPLQRTPLEYRDIRQLTTYFGRLGAVELVYPEVCGRRAGLG
jgi:hypothetical protein